MNNSWLGEPYESVSFKGRAKPGYTVTAYAENSYGLQSQVLSAVIG